MSRGVVLVTGKLAGYFVKGTAAKAEGWIAKFPAHKARYQYAVVADIAAPGAFDDAVKGFNIIAHIASPVHLGQGDAEKDVLIPAINGMTNLLRATKGKPRIKCMPGKPLTEKDRNPTTYNEAKASPSPAYVYRVSKALAERAFWHYIKAEQPTWAGATICPCGSFGPPIQPLNSLSSLNISVQFMWDMANGKYKGGVPTIGSPFCIDARDVALAHVCAVERDVAKNQRYLLIDGIYAPDECVDVIQRHFPELCDNLPPVDLSKAGKLPFKYDASKTQTELGIEFTPLETMVVDTIRTILDLKKQLSD
ncbi:NAD-P-binding protein [Mycena sp. CBHHK59/15]|nr:NAD-P-binding protein [Mycena sp. CBHHK59/15]